MSQSTMKIRGIDSQNDWLWGQGLQSYQTGSAAIAENLVTSLQCYLNDAFWQMDFGVDWWNLIGARNPAAEANILLQTRGIIINSFGVTAITSVSASFNSLTRKLNLQYAVSTIYSTNIEGTVSVPPN